MLNIANLLEKCKSKLQRGITSDWSEWPSSHSLQIINKQAVGEKELFLRFWWEYTLVQPLWRTVWRLLHKLKTQAPYDAAILLLGIHQEKARLLKDICTPMFIAARLSTAKNWKQLKCPDEWVKKMYIHTMKY